MGCNWNRVRDEAGGLSLRELLAEASEWIEIETRVPSCQWGQMLSECEHLLQNLQENIEDLEAQPTSSIHQRAKMRLVDFCSRLRCLHDEQAPSAL
jgi:hypothetical protein